MDLNIWLIKQALPVGLREMLTVSLACAWQLGPHAAKACLHEHSQSNVLVLILPPIASPLEMMLCLNPIPNPNPRP